MANALSDSDINLLAHLRKNARIKIKQLSRETGLPVSTIFDKVKGPIASCVEKYTCILKNSELGFSSRATIILKVDKEQKKEIGAFLEKHENVNSLFRINNGYDFLADIIFRQMGNLEEFIECLERKYRIKQKEVYFIIDEVKQESFLAEPQTTGLATGKVATKKKGQ
ncbi:Lrp/AsnC family transcriptional regulator [Candidatus Woesearchaeota archaeon]|nr:Lrp/AsnC family transcriptional regulator [Candidatus Woesearchaeota archaeon]